MKKHFHLKVFLLFTLAILASGLEAKGKRKRRRSRRGQEFVSLPYGMGGCGLGSVIFGTTPNPFVQSLASFTNRFYSTHTFAISLGTSNCKPTGKQIRVVEQHSFLSNNLYALSKESAQGQGIYLQDLATLFGCSENSLPQFQKSMRNSYQQVFTQPGSQKILAATHKALYGIPSLRKSCTYLYEVGDLYDPS